MSGLRLALAALVVLTARPAAAWDPPTNVSQSCCGAYFPALLHDDADALHLWWVQVEAGDDPRWLLTYARDDGGGFGPGQTLAALDARVIAAVADGPALQLVFSAFRGAYGDGCEPGVTGGCSDLWVLESSDRGASWSAPVALPHPDDAVQRYDPALARAPDGALVVAYDRDGAVYTYTRPPAGAWAPEAPVSAVYAGSQHAPRVAFSADGGATYTHLWMRAKPGDAPGDVLLYTRHDGVAWSPAVPISAAIVGGALVSAVAGDGAGALQVAFQSSASGEYAIYWISSADHGVTWTAPVQLSAPGYSARPAVARERHGPTVHVVWDRGTAIAHSPGVAGVFAPEAALSGALEKALEADVSAGSAAVVAAFHARAAADAPYDVHVTRQPPVDPAPIDPTTGGETGAPATTGDTGAGSTGDLSSETGAAPTTAGPVGPTDVTTGGGGPATGTTDATDATDTGGPAVDDAGGCGCATGGPAPLALLLALAGRRRRRR